jgi:HEPN domain-containing protein
VLLTHSVVTLVRRGSSQIPALSHHLEGARELDLHYVPSRYPNGLPSGYPHQFYGKETAEKAIAASRAIVSTVEHYYGEQQVEWPEDE